MSDRNEQLRSLSFKERSKNILAGHPMTNWRDNLAQLHRDMIDHIADCESKITELERHVESLQDDRGFV